MDSNPPAVQAMCQVLGVSRSGYYAHLKKPARPRRQRDEKLRPLINESFQQSRRTYGSVRIVEDLHEQGEHCGKNRVRRLMKEQGLHAWQKRRFRPQTTDSNHTMPTAPNWLAEVPAPVAPNQVWAADITYIPTVEEGTAYLAGVMDLFSRRVRGWALGRTMETALVEAAFVQAVGKEKELHGLIHHSDRGSQYTSRGYRQLLSSHGVCSSMSRKGNCYDNAFKESFWASLKSECLGEKIPRTFEQAETMLFDYIDGFYNTRRRHSSLGYISPAQFESNHLRSHAAVSATVVCGANDAGEASSLISSQQ